MPYFCAYIFQNILISLLFQDRSVWCWLKHIMFPEIVAVSYYYTAGYPYYVTVLEIIFHEVRGLLNCTKEYLHIILFCWTSSLHVIILLRLWLPWLSCVWQKVRNIYRRHLKILCYEEQSTENIWSSFIFFTFVMLLFWQKVWPSTHNSSSSYLQMFSCGLHTFNTITSCFQVSQNILYNILRYVSLRIGYKIFLLILSIK